MFKKLLGQGQQHEWLCLLLDNVTETCGREKVSWLCTHSCLFTQNFGETYFEFCNLKSMLNFSFLSLRQLTGFDSFILCFFEVEILLLTLAVLFYTDTGEYLLTPVRYRSPILAFLLLFNSLA